MTDHGAEAFNQAIPGAPADPSRLSEVAALESKYRLGRSYMVRDSLIGNSHIPFAGQRVLEIGGMLPHDYVTEVLQPRQWVSVLGWVENLRRALGEESGNRWYSDLSVVSADMVSDPHSLAPATVIEGDVQALPASFDGYFDCIYSANTMEHVLGIGSFLERCHRLLRPGGRMFAIWMPYWPAPNGHHNGEVACPQTGNRIICPPWAHLYMRPVDLYHWAKAQTDVATADRLVHLVFHDTSINRYFYEDYKNFFMHGPLQLDALYSAIKVEVPLVVAERLKALYPDRMGFDHYGMIANLTRPA